MPSCQLVIYVLLSRTINLIVTWQSIGTGAFGTPATEVVDVNIYKEIERPPLLGRRAGLGGLGLVAMTFIHDRGSETIESFGHQRLCEKISNVDICANKRHRDLHVFDHVSHKKMPPSNVLHAIKMLWVV